MELNKFKKKLSNINHVLEKASLDDRFKQAFLKHPKELLKEHHVEIKAPKITIFENKKDEYHLLVLPAPLNQKYKLHRLSKKPQLKDLIRYLTTLCHEDPKAKDSIIKNCNSFLKEKGISMPDNFKIHVHIVSKEHLFLVIPYAASNNENLSDFELQALAGGSGGVSSFFASIGNALAGPFESSSGPVNDVLNELGAGGAQMGTTLGSMGGDLSSIVGEMFG